MEVQWTENAIADLTDIYEHIARDSPFHALRVVDRITERSSQISTFPLSGEMVPEYQRPDVREIIEYSWRIIYLLNDSKATILTVVHGAKLLPDKMYEILN